MCMCMCMCMYMWYFAGEAAPSDSLPVELATYPIPTLVAQKNFIKSVKRPRNTQLYKLTNSPLTHMMKKCFASICVALYYYLFVHREMLDDHNSYLKY